MIHPMIAVFATLVILFVGFFVIYKVFEKLEQDRDAAMAKDDEYIDHNRR